MPYQLWDIVLFIIGAIVIIFGAYYTSYFLGKRSIKTVSGKNIRLRERFAVSKDKSFCLLEVKGKVYLVAVTNQSATLLDTIPADAFIEEDAAGVASSPFQAGAIAGFIQKVIEKLIARLKAGPVRGREPGLYDLDERITLQTAEEEDTLDVVYREMQARRAARAQRSAFAREDNNEQT